MPITGCCSVGTPIFMRVGYRGEISSIVTLDTNVRIESKLCGGHDGHGELLVGRARYTAQHFAGRRFWVRPDRCVAGVAG